MNMITINYIQNNKKNMFNILKIKMKFFKKIILMMKMKKKKKNKFSFFMVIVFNLMIIIKNLVIINKLYKIKINKKM